jgi:flagellum-specific ATP synthase
MIAISKTPNPSHTAATAYLAHALPRLAATPPNIAPRLAGLVTGYDGLMLEAVGLAIPVGTVCRVATARGHTIAAEVVGFRADRLLLMSYADVTDLQPGARLWPSAGGALVRVGNALAGRVIDGVGAPLDGLGPIHADTLAPLAGPVDPSPLDRAPVRVPINTGVRAIDALVTMGRGQRIGLIAGSGVGKSMLMGMISRATEADRVVIAMIGERAREVSDFLETKLPPAARARAVVVAVPASHPPVLRIRGAMRATAIAEYFRSQGQHVVLLFDSLTRVAHAQREVGLALGEPASARGYPPSAIALVARLVERAGASRASGGAITALYTVLADGDDGTDPVVDAARAILDGHVVLDRGLAERGHYPAIHPATSLSRCMGDLASPAHQAAARLLRRRFALSEANRDLLAMGAYRPGQDPELDAAMTLAPDIARFLAQSPDQVVPMDKTIDRLIAEFPA